MSKTAVIFCFIARGAKIGAFIYFTTNTFIKYSSVALPAEVGLFFECLFVFLSLLKF